jgi:3-oxoacyl-[acyl-carrier protein] reductase
MGLEVDLVDRTVTEKAVDDIVNKMGRLDVVVCNAGGGTVKFADEVTPGEPGSEREGESNPIDIVTTGKSSDCPQEMLTRVMDINLMTCFYTCMAAAKHMKTQKSGKIITVSSGAGIDSRRLYHPYGTAKAAIIYYTRTLAQELGQYNITVNCIATGLIHSGRNAPSGKIPRRIALGRWGTIEDCANVIEFLATNLSDYVTGKTITVDGGACEHR